MWLPVREAVALGYPLKILRLSIAVYRSNRAIRIDGVVSHTVLALRGVTAGSGLATTAMRVIMIRVVDAAVKLFPRVNPSVFVDDLVAEMTGPSKHIVEQLAGFIKHIAQFVDNTGQEISGTESLCTSSHKCLDNELCEHWSKI